MHLFVNILKVILSTKTTWLAGIAVLVFFVPAINAQEEDMFGTTADDSLLFGDEFDLGGDDFSFDFDEEGSTDSVATESDDFFGDGDAAEEELTEEDTAAVEDEWGFDDDSEAGDSTGLGYSEEEYPDHPLNFRKSFQGSIFDGAGLTVSFSSPQYVADKLNTWYSEMDYSVAIELPFHIDAAPVDVSFSIDIASFKFENSFPSGGTFTGVSYMPAVRAEAYGLGVEAGAGMYSSSFGIMAGLGYALQFQSIYFSAGYRWNWASKIDPIGSGWWLEPRITTGIILW